MSGKAKSCLPCQERKVKCEPVKEATEAGPSKRVRDDSEEMVGPKPKQRKPEVSLEGLPRGRGSVGAELLREVVGEIKGLREALSEEI